MHPELAVMMDAQNIERELRTLKNQEQAISIPLEKTRARRHAIRRDLQDARDKLQRVKKQRGDQEKELAELEERLAAANKRQESVTSAREATALESEIETAQAAADKVEQETLELMEREEYLGKQFTVQEEKTERDLEVVNTEIERLEALLKENHDLAAGLREERISAVNRMDEETRENYTWLVNKHGLGEAIANTSGGACSGCGSMLLPVQINKITDENTLHRCTHCYRYFIAD